MTGIQAGPPPTRRVAVVIGVLVTIVVVFIAIRFATDWGHILDGTTPDDDFAERYVAHPWLAYLHIVPGAVYLLGAPLQLAARVRTRHYALHRRLGRVLLVSALLAGVMAVWFGIELAWGGPVESAAAVVFGGWFLVSLVVAFASIRRGDVRAHRRWMVRAFAVGIGISTIRIWVGLFTGIQIAAHGGGDGLTLPAQSTFGIAFWLALPLHVLVGEWWLRRTPELDG